MLNQWFKFYGLEYLSDLKIKKLNGNDRSCLLTLLCYGSVASVPGIIEGLTQPTLKIESGCSDYDGDVYKKLHELGIILVDDVTGNVTLCNWMKRQERALNVSERVRKYRMKQKMLQKREGDVTNVTNSNETVNDREEKKREEKKRIDNSNTSVTPVVVKKKETKKDKLNGAYSDDFETFWEQYPNKVGKGKAFEVFQLLNDDNQFKAISAIREQVKNNHFWKDFINDGQGGDSPPHATTWLNQRRWEDVVKFIERKGRNGPTPYIVEHKIYGADE